MTFFQHSQLCVICCMSFSCRIISASETHQLRHQVLRPHQTLADCVYAHDEDADTFHVGSFDGEKLVSIGSFYTQKSDLFLEEQQYQLRGMATDPEYRGKGAGAALILFSIQELQKRDCSLLWCNARLVAVGFYEKLGFSIIGEEFDIPTIGPHYVMFLRNLSLVISH